MEPGVVVNHGTEMTPAPTPSKEQKASPAKREEVPRMKVKPKQLAFDIGPQVIKQFRIYNISSKSPVTAPYSRETEW